MSVYKKDDFADFISKIEIPADMNEHDEGVLHGKILKFCHEITPSSLYRYRTFNDNSLAAFKNDEVWLSNPITFNDPYDCLLHINENKLISSLKDAKNIDFDPVERMQHDPEFKKQQEDLLGSEFINRITEVNKTNPSFKITKTIREISHQIEVDYLRKITDLAIKSIKQSSLIGCFSEIDDSILMWSHYADNHKGFVLEYDFKELYFVDLGKAYGSVFIDRKIFPVIYSTSRFDATYYSEFHLIDNFFKNIGLDSYVPFFDKLFYYKALLYKSQQWNYEKEWRIIQPITTDVDKPMIEYACLPNIQPKSIILGHYMPKEQKQKLIFLAKQKKMKIKEVHIDTNNCNYELAISEV